jgi:uroporphyrin-III C-methyltransferase
VIYMGLARVGSLVAALREGGMPADMPAAAVAAAHTPEQRHVLSSLHSLESDLLYADIASPAVLVVGRVVTQAQGWQQAMQAAPAWQAAQA